MALWKGYVECWKDFAGRMDEGPRLVDYLRAHSECLKPETSKHLLSLGAGTGEVDHGLVSLLPHLTMYTAVDVNKESLDILRGRLEEFTGIEKHYVHGMMETYTGPPHGADIIVMSHVGYYFPGSFDQQIRRALSWLNEGGRILIVQSQDEINKLIPSMFGINIGEDLGHGLKSMDVDFTESEVEFTLDVSYPGPSYYGFLSVLLQRRATREEVNKALAALQPLFMPGTKKLRMTQSVFVIHNACKA